MVKRRLGPNAKEAAISSRSATFKLVQESVLRALSIPIHQYQCFSQIGAAGPTAHLASVSAIQGFKCRRETV